MWAGGKSKMIKKYQPYLPQEFEGYCEPFLGGGAMFIWAYAKQPNACFVLNDLNQGIMQIYKSIRDDMDGFLKVLEKLSTEYLKLDKSKSKDDTYKEWYKEWNIEKFAKNNIEGNYWAKLYEHKPCRRYLYFKVRYDHAYNYKDWSATKEAATLYFLMKTGFNGVWQVNQNTNNRFGTPCGLMKQEGSLYDKENILQWHEVLQKCTLLSGDFRDTLPHIKKDHYVFLDPPYRGGFADYGTKKDDEFQEEVIKFLDSAVEQGAYVLLSNRDMSDDFFEERKGKHQLVKGFDVTYTAGRRKKVKEDFQAKKAKEILMIGGKSSKS